MSTDGTDGQPLTRAQLRALREKEGSAPVEVPADEHPVVPSPPAEAIPTPLDGPVLLGAAPTEIAAPTDRATSQLDATAHVDMAASAETGATTEADHASPETNHASPETNQATPEANQATPEATTEKPDSRRGFRLALFGVLGVLALVVVVLGVLGLTQGPRLASVDVDPAEAIDISGSRVILAANQPVAAIEADQVTVDPAVPFTVDASGRQIGIRFAVPLDDATTYTVTVAGVSAAAGGPTADLQTSFRTPKSSIFLLQRGEGDDEDQIFTTDLTGESAVPVFAHPRISDFRATSELLVVAVEENNGSRLLVMRRDGSEQRELELPGTGFVSRVQVSDRGGLVGYSYSDRDLTDTTGRASVLVTQTLAGDAAPRVVEVANVEVGVSDWQFVPDSSSLLFIDFDGTLALEDPTGDAGVQSLGLAASILGIESGTYTAIVEGNDGSDVKLDLTTGDRDSLAASDPDYGPATTVIPTPDGTLRHVVQRTEGGLPTGQAVIAVDNEGTAVPITEVSGTDAIVQVCASPSGQYAAVTVAPDLPSNPYDDLLLPLPTTLHTRLIDLSDGSTLVTLAGFDVSWCVAAPRQ